MFSEQLKDIKHHPALDEITTVLCKKTQNTDRSFYQTLCIYFLSTLASSMRVTVKSAHRGVIPVNAYAIALGGSGLGKGYAVNLMENEFFGAFIKKFTTSTYPRVGEESIKAFAKERAEELGKTDQEDIDFEYRALKAEDNTCGTFGFSFKTGTDPALKQFRHKLLLRRIGSINFMVDEIAKSLASVSDILVTFLELYDVGKTKEKLIKNTAENIRFSNVDGYTPANLLMFGSPALLFDGSQTEDMFFDFLVTGYGRRTWFGNGNISKKAFYTQTSEEIYYSQINPQNEECVEKWSSLFSELAELNYYNWQVNMSDEVAILLTDYQIECEKKAYTFPEHQELKKAELAHRYFKVMKLAGVYSFLNKEKEMTKETLLQAILAAEESGKSFNQILNREKAYVRLAKFIVSSEEKLTQADLADECPWYKGSLADRKNMLSLAQAYAYKNHAVIKKECLDDVEFYSGQELNSTDLEKITLSASREMDIGYVSKTIPFTSLHSLMEVEGFNWCVHSFKEGHRLQANAIKGFNLVVLDIDGDISIEAARLALKEYTYLIHTTKSHTEESHRFRVILPMNYSLFLDTDEYKAFISNILAWFPFTLKDTASMGDIARKWLTSKDCHYEYNEGELLDVVPFIPDSKKNEEFKTEIKDMGDLSNLERWFLRRMLQGNRNNTLLRYAYCLVDAGSHIQQIEDKVLDLNNKLGNNKLSEEEIAKTILLSARKKWREKNHK